MNIKNNLFVLLFVFSLFLIFVETVSACTCSYHGAPKCFRFSNADAVFVGRIIKFQKPSKKEIESPKYNHNQKVFFEIEQSLKGEKSKMIVASTDYMTSCDYPNISVGQRWLIFANKDEDNGELSFGACGGSFEISNNAELDETLKELTPPLNEQHIFGKIEYGGYDGIKNIRVTAEGFSQKFTVRTDKNGLYKIVVPTPGKHKVQITIPYSSGLYDPIGFEVIEKFQSANQSVFEYEVNLENNACVYRQFDVYKAPHPQATASINGKAINLKEAGYPSPNLHLYRVGTSEEETFKNLVDKQKIKDDGSFSFETLGKGSYIIVFNEDNFPSQYTPYLKTYLPNTNDFSSAQIFQLEEGQVYSDLKVNLPKPFPMATISGKILDDAGKSIFQNLGKSGNGIYMTQYNLKNPTVIDSWGMCDFDEGKFQCYGPIKIDKQGNFTLNVFDEYFYLLVVEAEDKNKDDKHGFNLFKFDKATKPIKIIVNQNGEFDAEKFLKEKPVN